MLIGRELPLGYVTLGVEVVLCAYLAANVGRAGTGKSESRSGVICQSASIPVPKPALFVPARLKCFHSVIINTNTLQTMLDLQTFYSGYRSWFSVMDLLPILSCV